MARSRNTQDLTGAFPHVHYLRVFAAHRGIKPHRQTAPSSVVARNTGNWRFTRFLAPLLLIWGVLSAALWALAAPAAGAATSTYAFITSYTKGVVSAITTSTWTVAHTIAVGSPQGVAVTASDAYAFVASVSGNAVTVITTSSWTVAHTIPVGTSPLGVATTAAGKFAFVANEQSNNVSVIDTSTWSVTHTIAVTTPKGVATTAAGKFAFVSDYSKNNITVITTTSWTVVHTIAVGSQPFGVATTANGKVVFTANDGSNSVSFVTTSSWAVTHTVTVGSQPYNVATTAAGKRAVAANFLSPFTSVITTSTLGVTSVTLSSTPAGVGMTATGKYAVMGEYNTATAQVVTLSSQTVGHTITGLPTATHYGVAFPVSALATPPPGTAVPANANISPGSLDFVSAPANLAWSWTENGHAVVHLPMTGTTEALQVADARGSGAGWAIDLTSTTFKTAAGHVLPATAASVQTAPAAYACTSADFGGCTVGQNSANYPYAVPAGTVAPTATILASANTTTGMGDQTVNVPFDLTIPASAYAGTYHSTWTFSLVSGP